MPIFHGASVLEISGGSFYDVGQDMITYDNSSHVSNVNSGNTTTNNITGSYSTHTVDDRSTHTTTYGGVREQYAQAQFTYNQGAPKQADHQTHPQSRQPQNQNWGWEDAYMDETMVRYEEAEEERDNHMGFIEHGRIPPLQYHRTPDYTAETYMHIRTKTGAIGPET
ncbi:hypothetical protein BDQ17DRAFT_1375307 [Cyathus striatus]|nr:hypothetical protein BDQ17DRAFT_1375307 [Cyathus striatus]